MSQEYEEFANELLTSFTEEFPDHQFYIDGKKIYCDDEYTNIEIPVENFNMVLGYNNVLGEAAYDQNKWSDMMVDVVDMYKDMMIKIVRTYLYKKNETDLQQSLRKAHIEKYKQWQEFFDKEQ